MRVYKLDIPDVFRVTGVIGLAGGLIFFLSYHLIAKRQEQCLIMKLDSKYPDRWKTVAAAAESRPALENNEAEIAHL